MKLYYPYIILFILSFLPLHLPAQEINFPHLRDSLRSVISSSQGEAKISAYIELRDLYDEIPVDSTAVAEMLTVSDQIDRETEQLGLDQDRAYNMINTLVYLHNGGQWDKVYERAPAYLDFLRQSKQWNVYFGVQENLLGAYLLDNKVETTLRLARQLYDESVADGRDTGAGIALCVIGRAYREQRRLDEATRQFEEGLALLEKQEQVTPILLQNYWTYCGLFIEMKDYHKALVATRRFDEGIERFERQSGRYIPNYHAVLLRLYAHAYSGLGQTHLAEENLLKADSLGADVIGQTNSAMIRSEISLARQDYPLALQQIEEAQRLHVPKRDLIEVGILRSKADLLARLGRPAESFAASEAAFLLADTLSYRTFNNQIEEMRTQYEVDSHIAARQRQHAYLLLALGGCLSLALALLLYVRYNRIILRKNRGLYRRIKEQDRLADELRLLQSPQVKPDSETNGNGSGYNSGGSGTPQQRDLTASLNAYLLQDRNFAKADIDRSEIAASLATNRTTLSEAVKAVTGKTLMEYTRSIQLEEAKKMLESQPALTIETIAGECGFNTPRTFYRNFREHYNVSPTEYRKLAQEQTPQG